jgi:DNA-binding transcriptional LysR family regulator
MKLASLTALVAAIEEGSLRGAARRLNISQPALTKMLRALEVELSATLLIRTSKGVKPTEQGKALHARALTVVRELKLATNEISQLSGNMVGELTIGAVPLAVMLIIPETLRTFCRAFPNIRIKVTEELYIAQLQRLRKGEVDVAVGGIPDDLPKGEFTIEPLMTTTMVVVAKAIRWRRPSLCTNLKAQAGCTPVRTRTLAMSKPCLKPTACQRPRLARLLTPRYRCYLSLPVAMF